MIFRVEGRSAETWFLHFRDGSRKMVSYSGRTHHLTDEMALGGIQRAMAGYGHEWDGKMCDRWEFCEWGGDDSE